MIFQPENLSDKVLLVIIGAVCGQISVIVLYFLNKKQNTANVEKTEAEINKTEAETAQIMQKVLSDTQLQLKSWITSFSEAKKQAIEEIEKAEEKIRIAEERARIAESRAETAERELRILNGQTI